ncbi:MAG: carboxypeptidase-like regulatory domain-containing protein [Deltaproteobacteria bacterium]|nr:carboxypeptidase-like regulatory domain-containing protein [Deltaproteobacteria bacterium]
MKKLFMLLSFVLLGAVLFGCGTTNQASPSPNALNYYNITGSLQGKIMDAVTGAAIGGSNLSVYLIQGTSFRTPNTLVTNPNSPLCGNYAFNGIPVDVNTGEIRYKVVVSKPGYQNFEGDVELSATINFVNNTVVDNQYNMIGNIYLFPLGSSAGDVNVYVLDPTGMPVGNANVYLKQNVANINTGIIANTGDRLNPSAGVYPELQATTNSSGVATFTSASLTLGGNYNAVVTAMPFNGEQLATSSSGSFNVGTSSIAQYVYMTAVPSTLYATSASNQIPGTISPNGQLTITFNQPILLKPNTNNFMATLNPGANVTLPTFTGNAGGVMFTSVTGVLSNNNTTLTLTPPALTGTPYTGATITYQPVVGLKIILENSQTVTPYTLFLGSPLDVTNINTGNPVSGIVQLTSY